jgi:hypothetical protein
LTTIELPHGILLKQQAQRIEKEYTEGCKREKRSNI